MRQLSVEHVAVGVFTLGLIFVGTATAQTNRSERHRVPADYMSFHGAEWLEREGRVTEELPERVLDAMMLEAGDIVADIGCGSGYYARRIARRVQPGGTVYCEDIQSEMLEIMQTLAKRDGIGGIRPVLGTPTDSMLPTGEVDWIIIADVYHEMSDPESMLAGLRKVLSPDGRVALLEYRVEDGTGDRIKADHTMSVRQVLQEWESAGFELVELHEFLPTQHLFFFRVSTNRSEDDVLLAYDLFDAIAAGVVELEAVGGGETNVIIRIRRSGEQEVVITSPVGLYFRSDGETRDMVARRDGWILLSNNEWQTWSIRSVGRQRDRAAPSGADRLDVLLPGTTPVLADLMQAIQEGTYSVADSPRLYPPRTLGMEQAAVWIADSDVDYVTIAAEVDDAPIPVQYAVAFALVFCDLASIEVNTRRIWLDRDEIFGVLRDPDLARWYQLMTGARVP